MTAQNPSTLTSLLTVPDILTAFNLLKTALTTSAPMPRLITLENEFILALALHLQERRSCDQSITGSEHDSHALLHTTLSAHRSNGTAAPDAFISPLSNSPIFPSH